MACRSCASLLTPEADKVGGAPSVGVPCNAAMAPGHDAAPDSQGPRPRWAAGHDSGQEVRLKCIVCVRSGWRRCSSVSPWSPRPAAAATTRVADTSGGSGAGPAGRHPELRRRPGAHRVQQQHLQGQRHLGGERHQQRVPGGLQPHPGLQGRDERGPAGLGRADQRGPADGRLQDQAERRLVGRHPDQRRRLHLPVGELQRHARRTTTSPAPPATTRSRASPAPTTARRSPSSTRPRSATGSRCSPRAPTSCPPTTWRSSRAAGTPGWTRTPRTSPRPAGSRSRTRPRARA